MRNLERQRFPICRAIEQFNRECAEKRAKQESGAPKNQHKRVHNYIIDTKHVLGSGTFSAVYLGHNTEKDKEVAVKITELKTIEKMGIKQLFWEELNIIQQLKHPNIVTCLQYFRTANNCYTIYEFCEGGDLASILAKGHLGDKDYIPQANAYIKDIFQGLLYLESMSVIHRDIKAANILISRGKAKIGDFGFATRCKSEFKDASIGSPAYMAPEGLLYNVYGPKTDVWAFGMLVYEILHGESPFSSCQSQEELKEAIKIPVNWDQLKATLPSPLKRLILKCLKVSATERPSFSSLLADEYIQKLYQIGSNTKDNQKSSYSKKTSDSEKIYQSVRLTPFSQKLVHIRRPSAQQDTGESQVHRTNSVDNKIEIKCHVSAYNSDFVLQAHSPNLLADFNEQGQDTFAAQKADGEALAVKVHKFYFLPEAVPEGDANYWKEISNLYLASVKSLKSTVKDQMNFAQVDSIAVQLAKEVYLKISLPKSQISQQNLQAVRAESDFAEQLLAMGREILFGLIKHLEKLIDKHEMGSSHHKQSEDSRSLALSGNHLILCYKAWSFLSKKQPFSQLSSLTAKDLHSSQQFYIWLYEIELEQMQQQSR